MTYTDFKNQKYQPMRLLLKKTADHMAVHIDDLLDVNDDRRKSTERRYMTFALLQKAGYTHQDIADLFDMNRENVTKALTKFDVWVTNYADTRGEFQRLTIMVLP
jgi:hypothetical protein